jgi:hypothetical protein
MATSNPHESDPAKGEIWELGYLAGWQDPEHDHILPFAPELLDVYQAGDLAGRDDRRALPAVANPPQAQPSADPGQVDDGSGAELAGEAVEHLIVHAIGEGAHFLFGVAGGLVSLVLTVVTIPGDVQLKPLEPDFQGPADQPGDTYIAACPRNDHPMVIDGVTNDGYWIGQGQVTFAEADAERKSHGHAECFVARCSMADQTCGPVAAVQ